MCGICGFSGPPDNALLEEMSRRLTHRGPDGKGSYSSPAGRMNLAHRRLAIIDPKTGKQPLFADSGQLALVCNGEIYNYKELRSELQTEGYEFGTNSDCEPLLALYRKHDAELLSRLNGMFAFALWDESKQRLLLARDRLGVKPLYWAIADDRLVFASEIKSLLSCPGIDTTPSHRSISLYLSLRNIPEPATIYEGVHALPPGHYLEWKPGREPVIRKYWDLDFTPGNWSGEEEICDALEELLLNACKLRMRADVPVGAYLSGGVDSSLVVAMVRSFHNGPFHTFSLGYSGEVSGKDDAYYARRLAGVLETDHHEMIMQASELEEGLSDVAYHLDQPFAGVLSTYFLTKLVRRHVKVVLSGDGADDLFGSYGHHRLVWPLYHLEKAREAGAQDPYAVANLAPLEERVDFLKNFEGMTPWEVRSCFGAFPDKDKLNILSNKYKHWVEKYSVQTFLKGYWDRTTSLDPMNAMLEADVHTLLPNEILYFADRLSMAHSVEVRSPFLDYRIAELAASIPGTLKIKGNILKYILKKVAARYLPREIIDRPKEGFVLPKHVWLRNHLDDLLTSRLSRERLQRHGFWDYGRLQKLIAEQKSGIRDHSFRIWSVLMFQLWYDNHFNY